MDAPLALYRRYRPELFTEVIGQDHVTGPLRQALSHNRVHHAYLFSGPRGCGKTTSARILARALNCAEAPVAEPCGRCQSCADLGRGGPGSMDVLEIDAASHNGVDDARDLREKAFFTPVSSRYKIYILDEAHMITAQGFNALLKLVEEPPAHVKFIFATTEPDKVIGTIRSRTHHYPFRLVPPRVLSDYLAELCRREAVELEPSALPLVVRAAGGSVRDALSLLDQLIGGAGSNPVSYRLATSLLGYTPDSLLDEVVDAVSAGDGAAVFAAVDKVIETGQEPRRFAEDLLQRLRDLIIVAAVPEAVSKGLIDVAEDQAQRLETQAARFGRSDLTRAAEVVSRGLDEIRGATAPRLLLELICARVLLPGADSSTEGLSARLDRLERRLAIPSTPSPPAAPVPPDTPPPTEPAGAARPDGFTLVDVRRLWPEVMGRLRETSRTAWSLLSREASVLSLDGSVLLLGFKSEGLRRTLHERGDYREWLRQALLDVMGVDWTIEVVVDAAAAPPAPSAAASPGARTPTTPAALAGAVRPGDVTVTGTPDDDAQPDDPVVAEAAEDQAALLARELGAEVIEEISHAT